MESLKPFVLLIPAWAVYFFLHSAMASDRVKKPAYRIGVSRRSYRLFYSLISSVGLLALLFLNGAVGGEYLVTRTALVRYAGLFLAGGGIFILRAAFKVYSLRRFIGIHSPAEQPVLHRQGILTHIRHPVYSATILITLGFLLFDPRLPSLISVICVWLYLPAGIYFEEKKLIREFGESYRQYQKEVPALIPRIRWPG